MDINGNCSCITKNLRDKVRTKLHAPPHVGHCGIVATTQAIETYFYWHHMKKDVHELDSKCMVCRKLNMIEENLKAFCYHFLLLKHHGRVLPWNLSLVYLSLLKKIIVFGRCFVGLESKLNFFLLRRLWKQHTWLSIMCFPKVSSLIGI